MDKTYPVSTTMRAMPLSLAAAGSVTAEGTGVAVGSFRGGGPRVSSCAAYPGVGGGRLGRVRG